MRQEIYLFPWELESMGEYSCSLPSATTIGKKWKRNQNAYRSRWPETEPAEVNQYATQLVGPLPKDWWVGEYIEDPDPKLVGIDWRKVVLLQGPKPRDWTAPDWYNTKRWKEDMKREEASP